MPIAMWCPLAPGVDLRRNWSPRGWKSRIRRLCSIWGVGGCLDTLLEGHGVGGGSRPMDAFQTPQVKLLIMDNCESLSLLMEQN